MRAFVSLFAVFLLVIHGPAISQQSAQSSSTQQISHWMQQAAQAYHRQDHESWVKATEELHKLRPHNQDFMTHLVRGYAQLGELSKAFDMMLTMQQQGLAVKWDEVDEVEPLREHRLYNHLNRLMTEAGEPFGDVHVWSRLDGELAMPEALAHDAESGRMFVGTIRDGKIMVGTDGETWEEFASPESVNELQGVFDLAVDSERGNLWVATGRISHYQGRSREDGVRSSLLKLNLESGELKAEYPVSTGSGRNMLGSLVVASDGTVFAADTQSPVIYRLQAGGDEISPYFGHQNFTSLRGMALSDDDSRLYVADYELGIFVIDATGGEQAWKLHVPEALNEGGIDGLFWWEGHLVAIQNAVSPQRIVRLQLGPDGLGVTAVAPIAAARPEFDTPTFGVMNGQDLYFLAGSHWRHVDRDGSSAGALPDVPIMKLDVDAASVQVVGQQILEELKRQQQR
jgi:pentatricopeptide repeat protein